MLVSSSFRWLISLALGAVAAVAVLAIGWIGIAVLIVVFVPSLGVPSKAAVLAGFLLTSGVVLLFGSLLPLGVALVALGLIVTILSLGTGPSSGPA
jgi:hypothetical protein